MAIHHEIPITVYVSIDCAGDINEAVDYYVDKLYSDSHPNFWVNHIDIDAPVKAYDSITGEDI